jgi:hypothetical protein
MTATPGPYYTEGRTIYARDPDGRHRWNATVDTLRGHRDVTRQELDSVVRLLAASWDLRRLLARIVERNRTPDDVADPDVVEARRLLREIGI